MANSVEALKKDRVQRITGRLQSHQVHPTVLTIIKQLCSMRQMDGGISETVDRRLAQLGRNNVLWCPPQKKDYISVTADHDG